MRVLAVFDLRLLAGACLIALCVLGAHQAGAQIMGGGPGGFGAGGARGGGGPVAVGVMAAERAAVPVTVELPGRAVAYQMAAIRPRVGGEIVEIPYQPGTEVAPGTLLFRLEDETLAAELAAAESAVLSAQSALGAARATVERYGRLSGSGVSRVDLENAEVAQAASEASLGAALSRRDLAQLALRRTEVTSPISGLVSVTSFSVGDIVSAGQSEALTDVIQIDPIYVDVSESRARILRHQQSVAEGSLQRPGVPSDARLTLETGEVYPLPGRILSPGTEVSATTGTVPIRLQFPNPDRKILPGQFVRVTLTIGSIEAVLVPQRATSRSAAGKLTAFIARDGRAVQVALNEQGSYQNAWIVTSGLDEGDLLILDGLSNLRDGAEVSTVAVTIDADGVVRDADDGGGEGEGEGGAATQGPGDPAGADQGRDAPAASDRQDSAEAAGADADAGVDAGAGAGAGADAGAGVRADARADAGADAGSGAGAGADTGSGAGSGAGADAGAGASGGTASPDIRPDVPAESPPPAAPAPAASSADRPAAATDTPAGAGRTGVDSSTDEAGGAATATATTAATAAATTPPTPPVPRPAQGRD
ncbi:MAG: efflux RND transporter periplasmic adaptor subunit [Paracoccus sp. (in: a-proteobacteria)]|nr:efflux RND transporter periplasmic adaptor subunit [Paracoccus sp. (in: a-proteobacteria)]